MDWNEVFKGRLAPLCEEVIRARFPGQLDITSENCGEDRKGYASFCLAGWEWSVTSPTRKGTFWFTVGVGGLGVECPTTLDVRSWVGFGEGGAWEYRTPEGVVDRSNIKVLGKEDFKASIPLSTNVDEVVHQTMEQVAAAVDYWK